MSEWVEALKTQLRASEVSPAVSGGLPEGFDILERRRFLWRTLDAHVESEEDSRADRWAEPAALVKFLDGVIGRLRGGMVADADVATLEELADQAILFVVEPTAIDGGLRPILRRELARAVAGTLRELDSGGNLHRRYAEETGLLDAASKRTPLGDVALMLGGRDLLVLLLENECVQSTGFSDIWRVSRGVLVGLREENAEFGPYHENPFAYESGRRLADMGVCDLSSDEMTYEVFSMSPGGLELVDQVLSDSPNAMRTLVHSLHAERAGRLVQRFIPSAPAASPGVDYGRMVAHEIKNAVVPAMLAVERLFEDLSRPGIVDPGTLIEHRDRITGRLQRVMQFAVETEQLSAAGSPGEVSLHLVIRDAFEATEGERNGRIELNNTAPDVRIRGARFRWTRAFTNLIRNAAQAIVGPGVIRISGAVAMDRVHVFIDDSGPGVPEADRARIFRPGVSLRGGSGLGLADVHETAGQAGGVITCEDGPMTGARFHLNLPAVG